jgi:hypothetical protein
MSINLILSKLPFALHLAIETVAAMSFFLEPEKQLPECSPATKLVLQQYAGLLLSSNYICLIVIFDPSFDGRTQRLLAAALGSYHYWPYRRALSRLRNKVEGDTVNTSTLGGPAAHLAAHVLCLLTFSYAVIFGSS